MSGLRLRLRTPLETRLDLSSLAPSALAGLSEDDAARLVVPYGGRQAILGDLFDVTRGGSAALVISGDARLDFVGAGLKGGEILVEGPVGAFAGASMSGGRLVIRGDAGDGLASAMEKGRIEVAGSVGASLAGALPGDRRGMTGGFVSVEGHAGASAASRLRGGLVLVRGDVAEKAASDLLAGTLAVGGRLGPAAGNGMKRGSILLMREPDALSNGFGDTGEHDMVMLLLLARRVPEFAALFGGGVSGRARRFVGDRLSGGQGEILVLQ